MSVDLSKAVKGSRVYFRCGGEAVITFIDHKTSRDQPSVSFGDNNYGDVRYFNDGTFQYKGNAFDIIRIEPPAFDWKDVKPGMAFTAYDSSIWFYSGPHPVHPNTITAYCPTQDKTGPRSKEHLTRAPEHDIEVAV